MTHCCSILLATLVSMVCQASWSSEISSDSKAKSDRSSVAVKCSSAAAAKASVLISQSAAPATSGADAGALPETKVAVSAELTLSEIVDKAVLAYGGKAALEKLDGNCVINGRQKVIASESGNLNEMNFQQIRKGAKLRIDLQGAGQGGAATTTVFDGTLGWKSAGRWVSDLPAEAVKVLKEDRDRQPFVLAHFDDSAYSFRLIGRTNYRHVPVYAISVRHGVNTETTFFLDQSNFLAIGSSYSRGDGDSKTVATVDTDYYEYRPADGAMVPFRQVQSVNGKESLVLKLENAQLQRSIDDGLFRRPQEGGAVRLSRVMPVPIEYTQGELLVKVRINGGEPLEFLLDTGASETMVDRRTAAEHFLDKQGQVEISGASGEVTTNATVVRKLEMGNLALEDVHALMLDLSQQSRQMGRRIAGIIGSNVLSQFTVTFDFQKQLVTFQDAGSFQAPAGSQTVPFTQRPGLMVKAVLNGREEETFLLDTGAAFNHLPVAAAKKYRQGQPQHITEGTGLDGRPVRLGTLVAETVSVAKLSVAKVNFTYPVEGDDPQGRGGFFQTSAVGILGNPFWQNFIMTVDYRSQRLVLQPVSARKSGESAGQSLSTGDSKLILYRDYRAAELYYQKAVAQAQSAGDQKLEARALGRLGSLHRVLAHDLNRPEQARVAYQYFNRAQQLARKVGDREGEGRVLADWSLLYSDNGQSTEAARTMETALLIAPNDPYVNVDNAVHLYRARLFGDMQKYVDKTLFLDPSNWQALWYQVKLSEMFADQPKQVVTLKEILRFYPWSKLAREKLTALTALPVVQPAK